MSNTNSTLSELLPSWKIALTAEDKSPRTIQSYFLAAEQLIQFLETGGESTIADEVGHREIQAFLAYVLEGRASATAKQRYASLQQFFSWMELEEEIDHSPFSKTKPPKVRDQPIPLLRFRSCSPSPVPPHVRPQLATQRRDGR